jgi:branched-chain amino acid transport system permease protein
MPKLSRTSIALIGIGIAILAFFPMVGENYYIKLVTKIMALGIFAMSLDLLVGFTGLISLGHAAFFGIAGYVMAGLANKAGITGLEVTLPVALAASATAALVIGWLSIRTTGIYFIMITLALAQMFYYFFKDQRFWGGTDGMNIFSKPKLKLGDMVLLDLGNRVTLYYATLVCLVAALIFLIVLLRSPFGRVIVGIKVNEGRMKALGFNVARYKLVSFVIAGTLAGLAGYIEATRSAFINPSHLSWHESGLVLVMVLLGGMGTLYGPVLGAAALVLLEDRISGLWDHWLIIMGGFVIAVVLFLPEGIAGIAEKLGRKKTAPAGEGPANV